MPFRYASDTEGKPLSSNRSRADVPPKLSKRQRQILGLLQQGKVNKEVASELGIELGTVKQHIVAIFKKLNVSNRAMAVSKSIAQIDKSAGHEYLAMQMESQGHIEKRPVVVLSLAVDKGQGDIEDAGAHFLGVMGAAAAKANGIFLTRQGDAGDILFGIQKASTLNVVFAIKTACRVYSDIMARIPEVGQGLRATICAGLALAGMHRFGGWSEEILASSVITNARQTLQAVPPRTLRLDQSALELLALCDLTLASPSTRPAFHFDLARLDIHPQPSARWLPFVGRSRERRMLLGALQRQKKGIGAFWFLEGDMGMGKSALCRWLLEQAIEAETPCRHLGFTQQLVDGRVYDLTHGCYVSFSDLCAELMSGHYKRPADLIVLEDIHWLEKKLRPDLLNACAHASCGRQLVLLSGRHGAVQESSLGGQWLKIARLTAGDSAALVGVAAPSASHERQSTIARMGAGVPLFLTELARNAHLPDIPMTLMVAVAARLDPLRLDRLLLRKVAQDILTDQGHEAGHFAMESLNHAVSLNVLKVGKDGQVDFVHPFVKHVVTRLMLNSC